MALCIVRLNKQHNIKAFDCGNIHLNNWLNATTQQHQTKSLSRTYVLVNDEAADTVLGYYALAIRGLAETQLLPPAMTKKLPARIPGFTLARLGISVAGQGQGHGKRLLFDALRRAKSLAEQVGGVALFVDAKDDVAAKFYAKYGFQAFPSDPLTLVIPLATIPDACTN